MRKSKPQNAAQEGGASNPPRFASQTLPTPRQIEQAHQIEQEVQRELRAHPTWHFASLVVRRIDDGVCLQGVLEADDELADVSRIAQRVDGVRQVLNRLVITPRREIPVKG
ncbi:MAG TPA: BON domain-containing protein [Planctomycetaceae bacterium]|jgi:osmotically-inducible protein OsmY|nr:BON domain-containing protein [Planctomycetaceae bacterium]